MASLRGGTTALALLVLSCQVTPIVHLHNALGRSVQVRLGDAGTIVPEGGEIEFKFPYRAFSILDGERVLEYTPPSQPPAPDERIVRWEYSTPHMNARLVSDGSIVVLAPTENAPSAPRLVEQPRGFPSIPQREGLPPADVGLERGAAQPAR